MSIYGVRHRSDSNQAQIVDALRRVGCTVELIGRPVDLLVGKDRRNYLLEVKGPRGTLQASQQAFCGMWKGQVAVVRSIHEALQVVGVEAR